MAFVYLVRCADGSLYVGWTEDVEPRIATHNEGRGVSYTSRRRPVTLAFVESHTTAESARRRERQIKRWSAVASDQILAFRGPVIGRTADIAVAAVLAVAFGAVGIVCFVRLWTEVRVWREQPVGVR
jgi:putative endonuclease